MVHSTPSSGHPGIAATIHLLTNCFWWPTLQVDTITHIRNCPTCNVSIFSPTSCRPLTTFTSRVWSAFCQKLNINVSLTSGYHPQANSQVERLNQELTHFLRSYCHRHPAGWSRYLLWAEYAQNSLCKPATGLTPFQFVFGFQPPLFHWSGEPSDLPAINSWLQQSERTWNEAHVHLQRVVRRTKEQACHKSGLCGSLRSPPEGSFT